MTLCRCVSFVLGGALLLFSAAAGAQEQSQNPQPIHILALAPALAPAHPTARLQFQPPIPRRKPPLQTAAVKVAAPAAAAPQPPSPSQLIAAITLADIGFANGLHFANLGGHRELFVPLPQDGEVTASQLVLVFDDFSAHESKRNLEVLVNDRTVAAVVLDGQGRDRIVQVPLGKTRPKDGYLKVSFIYSGAATTDRCIDVRYVGDSVTIKPETAVDIDVGPVGRLDVATTAALLPRDVAVVLPDRRVAATDLATAITVGRALISSGRRVSFYDGYDAVPDLAKRDDAGHWARGIILVGSLADAAAVIDSPIATVAGDLRQFGMIDAVRVRGVPALAVADGESVRAGRLIGSPSLAATRGIASASVGAVAPVDLPADRVTFDQLGALSEVVEVFGRAELGAIIDTRRLPAGTRPRRLSLDVMVAPDGAGAKAVVSAFVDERLLGSTVAATSEATHLDLPLPDGLVGTLANIRVVVERDIAQGDCRFGPPGYPAQILGSSAIVLANADGAVHDFSDLTPRFARGIEILLPLAAADQPARMLGILAEAANQLSPDTAPLEVDYVAAGDPPTPNAPFITVSDAPPAGAAPRVRFDRGRVAVIDRSGRKLLDLGGFVDGVVAQVVTAGDNPGLWIKPLSQDGAAPSPPDLHLDHGDVAFIDAHGVALAMSTERDSVVRISYPDQVSWLTVAERFRTWIIGGLWLFATAALLLMLQRIFRRRPAGTGSD
jgi:cellulose synthase operon protein B